MKIALIELETKLKKLLATSGANTKDIDLMTSVRLERDLRGNLFSTLEGLGEVITQLRESSTRVAKIEVDLPSLKLINANGRAATLVAMENINLLCSTAKKNGIALIGIYNSTYHGCLDVYARAIAEQNLLGIISANGGPQGVVPFGGSQDIFGTNPIAYGIPTHEQPIVFDAATAKFAYGSIKIAREAKQQLPENAYLDRDGNWTCDPFKAISIIPFGEHKGYAINLLLEVMTGALVKAKSGRLQHNESELGSFMIAIDPEAFGTLKEFKDQTTQLVKDIQKTPVAQGYSDVRVPGYRGEEQKQNILADGFLHIDDKIWAEFNELCQTAAVA